jgi:hypothetical protein
MERRREGSVEMGQQVTDQSRYRMVSGETKIKDNLPFLDIGIYRRPDCSLGHGLYLKLNDTKLYLNAGSHHHTSNKQAVLSTLVYRGRALCYQDSLYAELVFLRDVFRQSG